MLSIIKDLEELLKPFRQFIADNATNPLLWLGLFILGLVVFWLTYSALDKGR